MHHWIQKITIYCVIIAAMAHHGMARHQEQADLNLGLANGKVPPSWSVEQDRQYSLKNYEKDLMLWSAVTDLQQHQMGPAAALRITGCARDLIREMPLATLQQGQQIQDPQGNNIIISGVQALLRVLQRRYGATDEEQQISSISELMRAARLSNESTDAFLTRFDILLYKAANTGGLQFAPQLHVQRQNP